MDFCKITELSGNTLENNKIFCPLSLGKGIVPRTNNRHYSSEISSEIYPYLGRFCYICPAKSR